MEDGSTCFGILVKRGLLVAALSHDMRSRYIAVQRGLRFLYEYRLWPQVTGTASALELGSEERKRPIAHVRVRCPTAMIVWKFPPRNRCRYFRRGSVSLMLTVEVEREESTLKINRQPEQVLAPGRARWTRVGGTAENRDTAGR